MYPAELPPHVRPAPDYGRVPYRPLQLHEHPRSQAETLECLSARIWSVPFRGRRAAAVAGKVSGLRRLCGLRGGGRAGGAPPAVRGGSAAAEAQPGRPARRRGRRVRSEDLDGAGQAVDARRSTRCGSGRLSRIKSVRGRQMSPARAISSIPTTAPLRPITLHYLRRPPPCGKVGLDPSRRGSGGGRRCRGRSSPRR